MWGPWLDYFKPLTGVIFSLDKDLKRIEITILKKLSAYSKSIVAI